MIIIINWIVILNVILKVETVCTNINLEHLCYNYFLLNNFLVS